MIEISLLFEQLSISKIAKAGVNRREDKLKGLTMFFSKVFRWRWRRDLRKAVIVGVDYYTHGGSLQLPGKSHINFNSVPFTIENTTVPAESETVSVPRPVCESPLVRQILGLLGNCVSVLNIDLKN